VLHPVVHLVELPGPFAPLDDQLLGQDYFGEHFTLHQGIYDEIRQQVVEGHPYVRPSERRTAYILAGFRVLDGTFRDVMEDSWKDWTGARSLYLNLARDFGLHRFSLYRRRRPAPDAFSYLLLVECRAVGQDNALALLDFVQRFRSHRMSGYLSVYGVRHLGLESYRSSRLGVPLDVNARSDWWKEVQDATAAGSAGSSSDLSTTSGSTGSEDRACRSAPSPCQLTAVEVTPRLGNAGRRWQLACPATPVCKNPDGESGATSTASRSMSDGSTNGLSETDLSYSVGDSSAASSAVGSGSDAELEGPDWDAAVRPAKTAVRRVWFRDSCLLEDVIAQAAERGRGETRGRCVAATGGRTLAKEYLELNEMLENLQCVSVAPRQSVRRKLW
ncbi:unnamed protein product, partial [Ixodes hexagonus]